MHPIAADALVGYQVDSAAFRERAPRAQLSDDPDTATAQTVSAMCDLIHLAAKDPLVKRAAVNAVRNYRGGPLWIGTGINPFESAQVMAESCWWWAKHFLRFKHHGEQFEAWSAQLGDPSIKMQLLISPDVLVRMKSMEGDCAIYTMMVAALLESLGLTWEICTGAVDRMQPDIFSHVWPRTALGNGATEALDASHGEYPGWQVPARDIYRLKVWDEGGNEVGQQQGRFNGLHAYRRRGMGDGVDPNTGESYGTGTDTGVSYPGGETSTGVNPYYQMTQGFPTTGQYSLSDGTQYSGQAYTAPAQNSAQWATFASNLVKSGLTLAEINSIQPGTVVSANGAILRQSTGYAVPVGSGISTLSSSLASGNTIFYLGFGLLALLAVGSMFKGK